MLQDCEIRILYYDVIFIQCIAILKEEDRNMKTQKTLLVIIAVLTLVAGVSAKSFAQPAEYTCTVQSAGPTTSSTTYQAAITLTWVSGSPVPAKKTVLFYAPVGYENQFLAVALTAMANGTEVKAKVDFTASGSTVNELFLLQ
jgi:hypothetical protein